MTILAWKKSSAVTILAIWMTTMLLPFVQFNANESIGILELEHNEQESEVEELSLEWDETTIDECMKASSAFQSHLDAHLLKMSLQERLYASRLLDPPDKRSS